MDQVESCDFIHCRILCQMNLGLMNVFSCVSQVLISRQKPNGDWAQESISGVFNKNAMISCVFYSCLLDPFQDTNSYSFSSSSLPPVAIFTCRTIWSRSCETSVAPARMVVIFVGCNDNHARDHSHACGSILRSSSHCFHFMDSLHQP